MGRNIVKALSESSPDSRIIPVYSPRQGGIDLTLPGAKEALEKKIHIAEPKEAVLIHAAAVVEWDSADGLIDNTLMAINVASWAKDTGIGFSIFVSTVSVYDDIPYADIATPCNPTTFYGIGKLTAEHILRNMISWERRAIVRLSGIWGWQKSPTLFWNRLLLAAVREVPPESKPIVKRFKSRRNYISAREAANCILYLGENRIPGLFLGAGRDVIDTRFFVEAVQHLPGSKLSVIWQDDGGSDEVIYKQSPEFVPLLKPFSEELMTIWENRPEWVVNIQ
ncbi:MAG: NAD(P)-dependent oxidoreductase [Deltaproteobacteria bacterium]|uniref:NAD(P)-dependent oxidoreductase n=1 Tax=Candidatus Zymogenus saltonus TaxID=2844893 RepID=A0A9D8KIR2_9DELT|nr:NAD(P)-dependent oxidoreductase [Candidatus Zymogenus saltonus]